MLPGLLRRVRSLPLLALAGSGLLLLSCGKVGAPVPPRRWTLPPVEGLSARQQGDAIRLVLPRPDLQALAARGIAPDHLEIYRALELPSASSAEESFRERARLIAWIGREDLARPEETLVIEDGPITFFGRRASYAARLVDARGRAGPLSNVVTVIPRGDVPHPPRLLQVADEAQGVVLIRWEPPTRNVDGSAPPNVLGYNIYRRKTTDAHFDLPLNGTTLIPEPQWHDRDFSYGTEYVYIVRAVARAPDGTLLESRDSPPAFFTPRDTFPPAPPEGVVAASAQGVISLFWMPNREPDVVGYYIYRASSAEAPDSEWMRLNPAPHPFTIYRDEAVQRGARYAYRVTAVDRAGNESRPSSPVVQEVF